MSSARRMRRNRRSSLLTLPAVLVVLVAIAAVVVSRPVWHTADHAAVRATATSALSVDYRTATTSDATTAATPQLFVTNTSGTSINLSDVTLRYYFTAGDAAFGHNCVQAGLGCSNITATVERLADGTSSADSYLQIGFGPGAGRLAPGQNSRAIELQLFRLDHKSVDQSDDWSFESGSTTYRPSLRITAYLRGVRVWGNEPAGAANAPSTASTQAGAAANPSGTEFDDFHYFGPSDPALAAHGWQARTGAGGPGIHGTWSASGVSFPSSASAQGGQVLQLQASTDGSTSGTAQAELQSTATAFTTGTYAARIYFANRPAVGPDGDHVNESFYPISDSTGSSLYSELDNEYMPNGGWGAPGPAFDTTSWYSATLGERVTHRQYQSFQGWHIVMITAVNDTVTYSIDGTVLFTSHGKYFPREAMGVHFNEWFIDLPFTGERSWNMQVNWFYYKANQAVSYQDVRQVVSGFYARGADYVNTLTGAGA